MNHRKFYGNFYCQGAALNIFSLGMCLRFEFKEGEEERDREKGREREKERKGESGSPYECVFYNKPVIPLGGVEVARFPSTE